ncbi:MAG: glutathione peroxidase [Cytophagales bacterium]|uniref:glutathione peroxidase n=1 Tax=Cyclobacterium marinum TaxID=104 RepID=UPI0011ED2CA0|nr:glutathione peroxidase [Cyclobacterium marinum]MBI0398167.1 glutathione peroxidase [Cyclobacterium marinum]MBR9777775.1 glutathione peroxidase [Cytophagales bacterium]|tara:strand:- start:39190 stop:39804 length:615 start_codon:yes stop_codon:yes gene_type:complete
MKSVFLAFAISVIAFPFPMGNTRPYLSVKANNVKNYSLGSVAENNSIYDFTLNDIDGKPVKLSTYKGKKLLIVNVASKCGYTPQYAALQDLYETYKDKITILAFPANNFGGQEPGTSADIKSFCSENYGISFPIFEKISVKGVDKHPLYRWLSDKKLNGWNNEEPSWNFCKYFINENGELVKFFPSKVKPMDKEIIELIEAEDS